MQPSVNPSVPVPALSPSRLRRDQLNMLRSLLVLAIVVLVLGLYHQVWPRSVVLGLYGVGTLSLASVGFFLGRFQVGQQAVLGAPMSGARAPSSRPMDPHKIQAYASMDEARQTGWTFFEHCGQFGAVAIPRWAHDGTRWFEYNGLDGRAGNGLSSKDRLFGVLSYRQTEAAPDNVSGLSPLDAVSA